MARRSRGDNERRLYKAESERSADEAEQRGIERTDEDELKGRTERRVDGPEGDEAKRGWSERETEKNIRQGATD